MLGRNWPAKQRLSLDEIQLDAWDALLRQYVDESGRVDYAAWRTSTADVAVLDEYLAQLSRGDPARDVSREARLAFLGSTLTTPGQSAEFSASNPPPAFKTMCRIWAVTISGEISC